jgi:predicted Fe-Mo cluster-binding NifX family protein
MTEKLLLTLSENDVAPRFDLTTEVLIASLGRDGAETRTRTVVLAHPSPEDLCQLILSEGIDVVVCGGIEEEYYEYLTWKKVRVLDSVMGSWERALARYKEGALSPGAILVDRPERKTHVEKLDC